MSEKPFQLPGEVRGPIRMKPGVVEKVDSKYKREGARGIFIFTEPLAGRRYAEAFEHGTRKANIIALCCSEPPEGYSRWTIRLLEEGSKVKIGIELSESAVWGVYGKTVGGTGTAVGTGKRNTELIAAFLQRTGESNRAAQICDSLVFEGYDDCFLPSNDELNLMYTNLKARGLGEFGTRVYWSSSEDDSYNAWSQRFSDGNQDASGVKDDTIFSVRAVRAF
jgi:hypothetical protein